MLLLEKKGAYDLRLQRAPSMWLIYHIWSCTGGKKSMKKEWHKRNIKQSEEVISWGGLDSSTSFPSSPEPHPRLSPSRANQLHWGTDMCVYLVYMNYQFIVCVCVRVREYNTWEAQKIDVLPRLNSRHCKPLCASKLWSSSVCVLSLYVCTFVLI